MEPIRYYFIVTNDASWKIDWNNFVLPPDVKLVLIADQFSIDKITQKNQQSLFTHIEPYHGTLDALKEIIANLKEKFVHEQDTLQIITTNEDDIYYCAALREHFNVPGERIEDIQRFTDKAKMKEALSGLSEHLPRHLIFDRAEFQKNQTKYINDVIKFLSLPLFIKPVSASSSVNIAKINSVHEFLLWCLRHQKDDIVFEIDQFIDSKGYHCDSIIKDGKVVASFASRYLYPPGKWVSEKPVGGSIYLPDDSPLAIKLKSFNEKVIATLQPKGDCCTHHEMFVTNDGEIIFLEIAKRAPGCFIPDCLKEQIGLDLREVDYKLRLGLPCDTTPKYSPQYHGWIYLMEREGVIKECTPLDHIHSEIKKYKQHKRANDHMENAHDLGGVMAEFLLCNSNYQELKQDFDSFENFKPYTLEEPELVAADRLKTFRSSVNDADQNVQSEKSKRGVR